MIRVGLVGTGSIADGAHGPAIAELASARLTAVLSRDADRGRQFLDKHHGTGRVHGTTDSFASDPEIDLAIVTSPDKLHFEHAKRCLDAGKHVLLEKPMTTSLAEAKELAVSAERSGLILAVGFHLRAHLGHEMLKARIDHGEIGSLRHIRAIWSWQSDPSNWRATTEVGKWWSLAGVGTHCLDLARWFAGDEAEWASFAAVTAHNVWQAETDESAIVAGQLATGPTVEVVSSVQFGTYQRLELFGSQGIAVCHGTMGREGRGEIMLMDEKLTFRVQSPFVRQLENVVDAIEKGAALRAPASVGIRALADLLMASDL